MISWQPHAIVHAVGRACKARWRRVTSALLPERHRRRSVVLSEQERSKLRQTIALNTALVAKYLNYSRKLTCLTLTTLVRSRMEWILLKVPEPPLHMVLRSAIVGHRVRTHANAAHWAVELEQQPLKMHSRWKACLHGSTIGGLSASVQPDSHCCWCSCSKSTSNKQIIH